MAQIESAEAAMTGFKLIKRAPLALVLWAVIMLALTFGGIFLVFGSMSGFLDIAIQAESGGDPTPEQAMQALGNFLPAVGLLMLLSLAASSILNGAMKRAVLRPEESAFGYLRIGMDELRLLVVQIAFMLMVWLVMIIFIGVVVLMGRAGGGAGMGLAIAAAVIGGLVGGIYLLGRLSLAPTQTFAERRINLFGSWGLTRGLFWPVFLAFLIAVALLVGLAFAGSMVGQIGLMMSGDLARMMAPMMTDPENADPEILRQFFSMETWTSPGMIFSFAVSALAQTLGTVVLATTGPAIYRQLHPQQGIEEAF